MPNPDLIAPEEREYHEQNKHSTLYGVLTILFILAVIYVLFSPGGSSSKSHCYYIADEYVCDDDDAYEREMQRGYDEYISDVNDRYIGP